MALSCILLRYFGLLRDTDGLRWCQLILDFIGIAGKAVKQKAAKNQHLGCIIFAQGTVFLAV
ncbi:MAG: hypothetical protein A2Z27_03850 [candidate division Zixibacteria bacterium RBG_16_50_21]|nr:MAG: hypothetical protein A2Z27_03850 [candidate division Zixibacteria bacterium RBG_16_50_21]